MNKNKIENDIRLIKKLLGEFDTDHPKNVLTFDSGKFPFEYHINVDYWEKVTADLKINELASLIKIIALAENKLGRWGLGSPSPISRIFLILVEREGFESREDWNGIEVNKLLEEFRLKTNSITESLLDWLLKNTSNPYIPFGFKKIRTNSLNRLKVVAKELAQEENYQSERAQSEWERHKEKVIIKKKNFEQNQLIEGKRNKIKSLLAENLSGYNGNERLRKIIEDKKYNLYDYKEELLKILKNKSENLGRDLIQELLKKFREPEKEKRDLNEIRKRFERILNDDVTS